MAFRSNRKIKHVQFIIEASVIAGLYAVLTILFAPISYGMLQVRISEALTILPAFTSAAIPGLFIGCLISNIVGGNGIYDIIFGSLATLIAAVLSFKMPKSYLVPLPPVIINAVVVGIILYYVLNVPIYMAMLWVAAGQIIACYGLGYPLMRQLNKYKHKIFSNYN
jgi:uncharacterized membrane protein